ncbi:MAG TPA: hypothetical protein PKY59_08810 [Pyrinomonadaceae bacterium]|nr:hypothetical protein [Pyrinomonadaceae bacterium]
MPFKDEDKKREYQREYKKRWYQKNKLKHIGYVRNYDGKIQEWFREYKKSLSCEICGENHPACLEFHHIDPNQKKFSVSTRRDRPSMKALLEEIAKCRVLCANCHRKEHWNEREEKRLKKQKESNKIDS